MRWPTLSRYCECGSIINAGVHSHAEGCPRNQERSWFRIRVLDIRVSNPGRWEVVRLCIAGALFYGGLIVSASSEIRTAGHLGGGLMMFGGVIVLGTCCRLR